MRMSRSTRSATSCGKKTCARAARTATPNHATKKRTIIAAGSFSFGYDANGNMSKRAGSNIGYTSYNLPSVINSGSNSSTLSYGAFRNRYKQVAVNAGATETTIYVTGLLEKVTRGSLVEYRHTIHGGKGAAAIHTRRSGGTPSSDTVYVHRDHLGSPELITNAAGAEVVRLSFSAYGERRDGSDWDGPLSAANLTTIGNTSRRGFTGHGHLDAVGLIHMNGRVYDPLAARFLSVDPILQLGSSQSPNTHAYVWNNPLTYIDPSGLDLCDVTAPCYIDASGPTEPTPFVDSSRTGGFDRRGGPVQPVHGAGTDAVTGVNIGLLSSGPLTMYGVEIRSQSSQRATPGQPSLTDVSALAAGAQGGLSLAGRLALIEESAQVTRYQRILGELQRALAVGNVGLVEGAVARLRATSAAPARLIGRTARLGARASVVAGPILAAAEAATGDAGYSKFLLYGSALAVGVFFPGVGTAYAVALLTLDVSEALNPITLQLDMLVIGP